MLLSNGTSQTDVPLKTPPHLTLLLGTDGLPPGCPTSLSVLLEKLSRTFCKYLSSKFLPALSLNNKNPLLYNHLYFLYVLWVFPSILSTIIGKTWPLQTVPCETILGSSTYHNTVIASQLTSFFYTYRSYVFTMKPLFSRLFIV